MKKAIWIIVLILLFTALLVWFSCNPFNAPKQDIDAESSILNELDGPDEVKATPPEQPDIPWTPALTTFKDNLKAGVYSGVYVVVNVTSNPGNNANYKISCQNYVPKLVMGDFKSVNFEVYATESNVQLLKDSISPYFYSGYYPDGAVLYDGLYKYLSNINGAAPKQEDPFIKMTRISMYKAVKNADGSRLIQIFTDSSYWTIYRKAGNSTVYIVQGKLDAIP
jgi:hypothetical protein